MKLASKRRWLHLLLLLGWIAIGLGLRFTNLAVKPLWADEFSTIVFSLGNSFLSVPLDQVLLPEQLLQPLQPNPQAGIPEVIAHLLSESNHPPLYFILSHFWLKLFPTTDGLVSAEAARSLSALFGVASIPLVFVLGRLAFRSSLVGQLAAALMAVSPFGIYLAQEARHYTLPVLWVIASLCCLVIAAQTIRDRTPLPIWICLVWVLVNGLGLATHYFFSLTLGAEALVIACLGLVQSWQERGIWHPADHWRRIWAVVAGTIATALVWIPVLPELPDSELTRWIYRGDRPGLAWLDPILQAVGGWITMVYLLPIQAKSETIVIVSGVVLILLTLWTIPKFYRGLKVQVLEGGDRRLSVFVLGSFVGAAVLLFFSIVYLFGADLTSAFRYNFVYFPAVVVLAAAGLASGWDAALKIARSAADQVPPALLRLIHICGRKTIVLIWLLSLLGGLTVVANLGYQKTHRPDLVARAIEKQPEETVLVSIAHQHHGHTGRLMGIALALQQAAHDNAGLDPHFLLVHETQDPAADIASLRQALIQLPRPLELWLINFQLVPKPSLDTLLEQQHCTAEAKSKSVDGYRYRPYRCDSLTFNQFGFGSDRGFNRD